MKKIFLVLLALITLFSINTFAGEMQTVDLTKFKDKTISPGLQGRFYDENLIVKANKWASYEIQVKAILADGCNMHTFTFSNGKTNTTTLGVGVTFYPKTNDESYFFHSVKEMNKWEKIECKEREASYRDREDRYVGLHIAFSHLERNGKRTKIKKLEFDGNKGTYNGDNYDAICKAYDDVGLACVALYRDFKINVDNNCTYINPEYFIPTDYIDEEENTNYYLLKEIPNEASTVESRYGCCAAGYIDNAYETIYSFDDDETTKSKVFISGTQRYYSNLTSIGIPEVIDGLLSVWNNLAYEYDPEMEDVDDGNEPSYAKNVITINLYKLPDNVPNYFCIGMTKPNKVLKNGVEVHPTYEFDKKSGKFRGIDYEMQILMKDGNKVIGRIMFKNMWHEKR